MRGLTLLLQSLGIKIDPAEMERAFEQGKEALPKLAQAFEQIARGQTQISTGQDDIKDSLESLKREIALFQNIAFTRLDSLERNVRNLLTKTGTEAVE
jgi:hypothetical protein